MEDKIPLSGKTIWQEAMKYGVLLGGATILAELSVSFLSNLVAGRPGISAVIPFMLNLCKLALCVYLMVVIAKKMMAGYEGFRRREAVSFLVRLSLFSSLIVAAWQLVMLKLISPDQLNDAIETAMSQMKGITARQSEEIITSIINSLPYWIFIVKFLICFIIGLIAAYAIPRSVQGLSDDNPFENRP